MPQTSAATGGHDDEPVVRRRTSCSTPSSATASRNLAIVGDVFSKPIVRAFDERAATRRPYDVDSLQRIYSSGAMWSAEVKQQLLDRMPNVSLIDIMNSSEGAMATQVTIARHAADDRVFAAQPDHQGVHRRRTGGRARAPTRSA